MSERDEPRWSAEGPAVAAEISERIRSILAEAEGAAAGLRHQADQDAQARMRAAETEALKIVEDARRKAEFFLSDRIERVSRLSDEILERGQKVVERLDAADEVRSQLADLVIALGETAARLANEVRTMPGPQQLDVEPPPTPREPEPEPAPEAPAEPRSESEPEGPAEPEGPGEPEGPADPDSSAEESEEPLRAPTPLRPEPVTEPEAEPPPPAAEQPGPAIVQSTAEQFAASIEQPEQPAAEAKVEPEAESEAPAEDEAALIEQVKAAERDRTASEVGNGPAPDGAAPDAVVEIRATEVTASGLAPDQALGARLVALQMAVAGGNRGEVENHLRRAFDLDEPGAILDDIFGSGTTSDKRVAWPEAG